MPERSKFCRITERFAAEFKNWSIELPPEATAQRHPGVIKQAGWLIQFCFGKSEGAEYLDHYAAHRMTSDEHRRIWDDGREDELEALRSMRMTSNDPVEDKRLQETLDQHNARILECLREKKFTQFTINMALAATSGPKS